MKSTVIRVRFRSRTRNLGVYVVRAFEMRLKRIKIKSKVPSEIRYEYIIPSKLLETAKCLQPISSAPYLTHRTVKYTSGQGW